MGCGDGIGGGEIRKVGGLGMRDWGLERKELGIGNWDCFFDNKPFELLPAGRQVLNFLNKAF